MSISRNEDLEIGLTAFISRCFYWEPKQVRRVFGVEQQISLLVDDHSNKNVVRIAVFGSIISLLEFLSYWNIA